MKKIILFTFVLFLFSSMISLAQEKAVVEQKNDHETSSDVPELGKFHKPIFQIWHKFYPSKDYDGLKKVIPEIDKLAEGIYKAELPGILRDKKKSWEDAILALKECIANYKTAAEKNENERLLEAAEKLHSQYEKMVRITKPMVKELDAFHVILYTIWHKYYPEYKIDSIKTIMPTLVERKDTLMNVKLKFRQETEKTKAKAEAFTKAKGELGSAVDELVKVLATDDKNKIKKAIEKVHTKYQATEKVFD
jgi:hypothetical protein